MNKIAESLGFLSQEKHGGSSLHNPIEVAELISLLFDYVIQIIRNAELGFYYAENCYVCIAHQFFSLTDQDFGMTIPLMICCVRVMKKMNSI